MTTILKTLLLPILILPLICLSPIYGNDAEGRTFGNIADADATGFAESGGSGSSHSETSTKRVVIINGETVVNESTHTINGDNVDEGEEGPQDKPWLGLRTEEASPALRAQLSLSEDEGIVIADVVKDGPADKAGLRVNDILLKFEGKPLGSPKDLEDALNGRRVGEVVTIEYLRRGRHGEADAKLEKKPGPNGNNPDPKTQEQLEDMVNRMREMMKQRAAGGGPRIEIEGVGANLENRLPNGGGGSIKIEVNGDNIQDLDAILDNPNLPEDFKRTVRDMKRRMQQFGAE